MAKGGERYVIVAIDYFTKWVEAESLFSITTNKAVKFVIKNIVTRFGIPYKNITDNGIQLESRKFTNYCQDNNIIKSFFLVAHPQPNRAVEGVNKTIKTCLKKHLNKAKRNWVYKLPYVL